MDKPINSPYFSNNKAEHKGSDTAPETQALNPVFEDLKNTETFNEHIKKLKGQNKVLHSEILDKILEQIERIEFKEIAFPEAKALMERLKQVDPQSDEAKILNEKLGKMKLKINHYLIVSIEQIIALAKSNKWNLCKNLSYIYLFNGKYWSELDPETFQKFLGQASQKLSLDRFTAQFYKFREQLFRQFISDAYLPSPVNDTDEVLINLQNGTFEIRPDGNTLRPFNPDDFLTYQLPFDYNKDATSPMFEGYLNKVLPDLERQNVLAEYLGYIFTKNGGRGLKLEKALLLYGSGANGKSVFYEIVKALLGKNNTTEISLQSLTNENGYFRAMIANKLVNYASEINGKLDTAIFKQLVSGEPVEARLPYGKPFQLNQYAKLIFNCNELPKDIEHTDAYFRRFLIIPFDVTIQPYEQDRTLHSKIIENELSGVFNWVLAGLERLLAQRGFSECEAAKKAVEQYRDESNSAKMFIIDNCYKISVENYLLVKEVYQLYRGYCIDSGTIPMKQINFNKQLKAFGFQYSRQSGTGQNIVYIEKTAIEFQH